MATQAEKLAELQAELTAIKARQASAISGARSSMAGSISASNWSPAELRSERTRLEKSIQRLLRGGRGLAVDLSYAGTASELTENGVTLV